MRNLTLTYKLLMICVATSQISCVSEPRTVLVPPITYVDGKPSDVLKLGYGVEARIYTFDGKDWQLSANEVVLPEGWLLIPPPPHGQ